MSNFSVTIDQFLLAYFWKIFWKTTFQFNNGLFEIKQFQNSNQSGFRLNDSCQSQFLSIVHHVCLSFDCHPSIEVRSMFLDISKAFDEV